MSCALPHFGKGVPTSFGKGSFGKGLGSFGKGMYIGMYIGLDSFCRLL